MVVMGSLNVRFKLWVICVVAFMLPLAGHAEVIFEENFDNQPDWTSAMHSTARNQFASSHVIPQGWYSIRQDPTWAPSVGHPDRHETIEILSSNSHKARGGTGKSFVSWRDSHNPGWNRWNSESITSLYLGEGYDQLYVEFWITFDPNWTPAGTSKIFRVSSWNGGNIHSFGGGNDHGPIFFWDYRAGENYGVSNRLSFRGGPHGQNYNMSNDQVGDLTRSLIGSGDVAFNYTSNMIGSTYKSTDPQIQDQISGGTISKSAADIVRHEQVFGPPGHWTKLAFFVKMNSAPGVQDGVYMQWLNDELIIETNRVTWVESNPENKMVKWNVVAIGGNDFFQEYPNEDRREEWYAIDDLVIMSAPPGERSPPRAPINIEVR